MDPTRQRKRLQKQAERIAVLLKTDAPDLLVTSSIATFVREAGRLYGTLLVRELKEVSTNLRRD